MAFADSTLQLRDVMVKIPDDEDENVNFGSGSGSGDGSGGGDSSITSSSNELYTTPDRTADHIYTKVTSAITTTIEDISSTLKHLPEQENEGKSDDDDTGIPTTTIIICALVGTFVICLIFVVVAAVVLKKRRKRVKLGMNTKVPNQGRSTAASAATNSRHDGYAFSSPPPAPEDTANSWGPPAYDSIKYGQDGSQVNHGTPFNGNPAVSNNMYDEIPAVV